MTKVFAKSLTVAVIIVCGCVYGQEASFRANGQKAAPMPRPSTAASSGSAAHLDELNPHGAQQLLRMASDETIDANQRRHYVAQSLTNLISKDMSLGSLLTIVGADVTWITPERIRKAPLDIGGWAPETLRMGKSAFCIPVLPLMPGDYHVVVLLALEEDVSLEDIRLAFSGTRNLSSAAKWIIAGCSTWDNRDQERRFPGSKAYPWPW